MSRRGESPHATPFRRLTSRFAGWLADRRIPGPLRAPLYRAYCRATGANPIEAQLDLAAYPSLGAFFVRRLRPGLRNFPDDPRLLGSPVDARVQDLSVVREGLVLQAKGQPYELRELLAGAGAELDLEGGSAWTLYLSPSDYHRIHAPLDSDLVEARWCPGARYSVQPKVLLRRPRVLATNERVVLHLVSERGPYLMVLVGALNVGRLRVVGVEPGVDGPPPRPVRYGRGQELGRFELGSTVVLVCPSGMLAGPDSMQDAPGLGDPVRMGQPLARLLD